MATETPLIVPTADGSSTLFLPELGEHYHSIKGALTESRHVFVEMGMKACPVVEPKILEVGFGTGLNAWLSCLEATDSRRPTRYTAVELHPLKWELLTDLYPDLQADEAFRRMHATAWNRNEDLTDYFALHKVEGTIQSFAEQAIHVSEHWDVIYFDAFSPEKQPEMWTQELFAQLFVLLADGGMLTTYCAKGEVRRRLQSVGFRVERLPGPPGGKREILRATKGPVADNYIHKQPH